MMPIVRTVFSTHGVQGGFSSLGKTLADLNTHSAEESAEQVDTYDTADRHLESARVGQSQLARS